MNERILLPTLLAALVVFASPAYAASTPGRVEFQVLRQGQPFGRQSVTVLERDGALVAETSADLRASLGPLTLFHYTQRCNENWRQGALTSLRCQTQQNGQGKHVSGGLADGALRMTGTAGAQVFSASTLPTSWWTRPPLATREMINSETGARLPVRVTLVGREMITVNGARIAADHIRVQGTLTVDLWYDEAGHWVNCAFTSGGQHMTYRLISQASQGPT